MPTTLALIALLASLVAITAWSREWNPVWTDRKRDPPSGDDDEGDTRTGDRHTKTSYRRLPDPDITEAVLTSGTRPTLHRRPPTP